MQVIQEGERRWYRDTTVTKSITKPKTYMLYGIGISGNPILIGEYRTLKCLREAQMFNSTGYIRAKLAYKKD